MARRSWFNWRSLLPLLIIPAGIVAYHNSFSGTFVLDDDKHILENRRLYEILPLSTTLSGRRPVVDLTLAINVQSGLDGKKLEPWGFHAFNLAVHLLAGLTLFGIVRRTLLLPSFRARAGQAAPWLALVVALIWVVHPLQTQSVTYIIQRGESMMGLFYLLTMYCVLRGAGSTRTVPWYVAAVIASALGMGSKGVMVTAPVVVLLYDWVFLSKSFVRAMQQRWPVYAGLVATWGVLFICDVAQGVLSTTSSSATVGFGYRGTTSLAYALTQPGAIAHYLRLSLWPHPLCLDYNCPVAKTLGDVAGPSLVIAALLAGTVWGLARKPWIGFVGLWFLVILAPTSSIIPIKDALFEHRMYLPLAAPIVMVVFGVYALLTNLVTSSHSGLVLRRVFATVLAAGALTLSVYGTVSRNHVYESDLVMWRDVLGKRPDNPRAYLGVGRELFHLKEYEEAEEAFEKAIELQPDYAGAYHNLGEAREKSGKLVEAEEAYHTAIEMNLRGAKVHYSLANALRKLDRMEESVAAYRETLRIDPIHVSAHVNLGNVLRELGRREEAVEHYQRAIALDPEHSNAHYNLGATLHQLGRIDEAIAELELACEYNPNHQLAERLLDDLRARYRPSQED